MPFNRPTPQQIRDRLAAEVEAALPGADARRRRSVEEVIVRAVAVASHEMHGHLAWAARQILPDSAEAALLDRHAAIWGITRRAAAAATGPVTVSGSPGAVLTAGAELRRPDDARFTLAADVTIGGGGTGSGTVTALVAGAAGNTAAATPLALIAPIGGITGVVVAAGGLAAGADVEADAALRARVLARIQQPPQGGAAADYVAWAQTVAGVGRVWVYPANQGAGTVGVAFLTDAGAIPGSPLVAQVQAAINALRPVTAAVTVFAPVAAPVNFELQLSPDTSTTRAALSAALAAALIAEAEPGGTLRLSRVSAALSAAAGETWHRIVAPSADVANSAGQISTLGTVTWA